MIGLHLAGQKKTSEKRYYRTMSEWSAYLGGWGKKCYSAMTGRLTFGGRKRCYRSSDWSAYLGGQEKVLQDNVWLVGLPWRTGKGVTGRLTGRLTLEDRKRCYRTKSDWSAYL